MYRQRGPHTRQKLHTHGRKNLEMPGIEPGAFHMRSERSTTELHPRDTYFLDLCSFIGEHDV